MGRDERLREAKACRRRAHAGVLHGADRHETCSNHFLRVTSMPLGQHRLFRGPGQDKRLRWQWQRLSCLGVLTNVPDRRHELVSSGLMAASSSLAHIDWFRAPPRHLLHMRLDDAIFSSRHSLRLVLRSLVIPNVINGWLIRPGICLRFMESHRIYLFPINSKEVDNNQIIHS
jgi:hypothetical protein